MGFLEKFELDTDSGRKKFSVFIFAIIIGLFFIAIFILSLGRRNEIVENQTISVTPSTFFTKTPISTLVQPSATFTSENIINTSQECSLVPYPSRLKVGNTVVLSETPNLNQRIRREPLINSNNVIILVKPGTKMTIIGGPECNDGWFWWYVKIESYNVSGWTSEGDINNYWLIPVD